MRAKMRIEKVVPFTEFSALRQAMATFDIGILPLANSAFNHGKSPLKALQMGMAGAMILASDVVYKALETPNIRILETQTEWACALRGAIEGYQDPGYPWHERAKTWQQEVKQDYCYGSGVQIEGNLEPRAMAWLHVAEEVLRCES